MFETKSTYYVYENNVMFTHVSLNCHRDVLMRKGKGVNKVQFGKYLF